MMSTKRATLWLGALVVGGAFGCGATHGADDAGREADGGPRLDAGPSADGGGVLCPSGQSYFYPGCAAGTELVVSEGCYSPCGDGLPECEGELVCRTAVINPCVPPPDAEGSCAACGAQQGLCLPPAPTDCAGRDYCDCSDGCEPLIDLTTGCVCPCDDPFNCDGTDCACACGGASYLGCAPRGQCAEPQIDCDDCEAAVLDGCPVCVCPGG